MTSATTLPLIAPYADKHKNPSGPGDARPTALQVIRDQNLEGKWADKVVLVTGPTSGIGLETAKALHATGAKLVLAGLRIQQDKAALGAAAEGALLVEMDLADPVSIKKAASEIIAGTQKLNVAIFNAGLMRLSFIKNKQGLELHFAVNYFGHFLLFNELRPLLEASATPEFASRIVTLSSLGHHASGPLDLACIKSPSATDRDPHISYCQSKLATLYLANEIDRRYSKSGIHANSVSPGTIITPLCDYLPDNIVEGLKAEAAMKVIKSPQQGAACSVWAACAKELEGLGGIYLEDERVALQFDPENPGAWPGGYVPYAYDKETAGKLWDISCELAGI